MSESKPEAAEHGEAVGVLVLLVLSFVPLVGGEPAEHKHGEGRHEEDPECVDVDVGGEGVEEGEEGGGGRAGPDVEDGDPEVEPRDGEGEGAGTAGRDGDVCYDEVRLPIVNLSQHPIPVTRRGLTAVLTNIDNQNIFFLSLNVSIPSRHQQA